MKRILLLTTLALLTTREFTRAQGTAFTYHGRLTTNNGVVNGNYEFNFSAYNVPANGAPVAGPILVTPVTLVNGLFTAVVDFGPGIFTGPSRYLEISVRPVGGGAFVPLTPRQELTSSPYAIHAATASSALDVATGTAVKSLNNLRDNVTLAAGANVTLTPSGNTLTIASAGAGGSGIWSLNGNNTYYNAGSVGIGTVSPTPGVGLEVNGPARVTPGGSGGYVQIAAPNGETGLGIIGVNRCDLRFDGTTVKLVAGPGIGPPLPGYGITINTNGNVGVGLGSPLPPSQWKLEVNGPTRLTPGGSGGAVQFSAPNGESGMSIIGVNRADVRFDGTTLKLVAGAGTGPPSSLNGIAIHTSGNVGVGTTTPVASLHVETSETKPVVYGNAIGAGTGLQGRSVTGVAVYADGNAAQARDKGGFVKAMAFINPFLPADQYIVRCFNSQPPGSGSSTAPCGIIATRPDQPGHYVVDFGFKVDDRFISVTLESTSPYTGASGVTISRNIGPSKVELVTRNPDGVATDSAFNIIVY